MKKLAVLLLLVACSQESSEVVESTSRPVDKTETSTTEAPPPAAPAVTGPKLAFVDEAAKDPSFAEYRAKLLTAVRARDAKAVVALSDPHIRTSFGGDDDVTELEKVLTEDLWRELEETLELGGTFREGMFWAPYVYSAWPDTHDSFETLAVIADDVPLRASADRNAPAIATLSHDLVTRASQPGEGGSWQKVTLADGRNGFVEAKYLRSPVDYRAGFSKGADGWRMTAFVAGD
ncbi:MAG TPA: SH3 domain-containing protein [Thermoanaerobaculia bacterium]|jgi:hypothetical protein|nr:SH3 domain-containing protein [Thermoanaerobaculia bacterium]